MAELQMQCYEVFGHRNKKPGVFCWIHYSTKVMNFALTGTVPFKMLDLVPSYLTEITMGL